MKVCSLHVSDFMLFDRADIPWSAQINVISGGNSTGKTALLKILYAVLRGQQKLSTAPHTKEQLDAPFVEKLQGCFRPDDGAVGRLVRRKQGSGRAQVKVCFDEGQCIAFGFGSRQERHMDIASVLDDGAKLSSIYLPPKEIISTTENFSALYEDYHIAFEETYYDLSKLLARPLRKGPNTKEQNAVLDKFGMLMGGLIVQRENKFYLKVAGEGEFEMGLVSEGYRKLATIVYLIQNGSLGSDTVLFWDEPETNMNPKMILPLVEAIVELARMGVQIFLTTHDYFVQQYVNLQAVYGGTNRQADILFTSLYRDESGRIGVEQATNLSDLTHNTIMEEFDSIYDREQGLIYEGIRKQD